MNTEKQIEICVISQRDSQKMGDFSLMLYEKFGIYKSLENVRFPLLAGEIEPTATDQRRIELGNIGCFASHRRAIENAHARGEEYLIVCEHDCFLTYNPLEFASVAIEEIETHDRHWKCINLGGCRFDMWFPEFPFSAKRVTDNMFEVRNMTTTHGMVYHVPELLDLFQLYVPSFEEAKMCPNDFIAHGYAQDLWLSRQGNYYTTAKPIAFQTGEDSVIGNTHSKIDEAIKHTYNTLNYDYN